MKKFVLLALLLTVCSIYFLESNYRKQFNETSLPSIPSTKPNKKPENPVKLDVDNSIVNNKNSETILLTEQNSMTFRGPVTPESVANFQRAIITRSHSLKKDDIIYIVMDTPGGSVMDGAQMIDTVNALPQKIKSITIFAASMGFQFVQNFDERLITSSGVLMSHRASGGFRGEFGGDGKGELITQLNFIVKILKRFDDIAAGRMLIPTKEYQEMIRDEYWSFGQTAVDEGAADKVVKVICDKKLMEGTETLEISNMFFKSRASFSRCPLISSPISISNSFLTNDANKYQYFIDTLFTNKRKFVKEFIITDKYLDYLQ
jgi:ATP-dependent protease ClpP protease subunit